MINTLATPAISRMHAASTCPTKRKYNKTTGEDPDILIADARYRFIQQTLQECLSQSCYHSIPLGHPPQSGLDKRIVLNRFSRYPDFLGMMYPYYLFSVPINIVFSKIF